MHNPSIYKVLLEPMMDPNQIVVWQGLIAQMINLGVKTYTNIKALMREANVDEEIITAFEIKWDTLYASVKKASEQ